MFLPPGKLCDRAHLGPKLKEEESLKQHPKTPALRLIHSEADIRWQSRCCLYGKLILSCISMLVNREQRMNPTP
jgi:hypothetical protein